MQWSVLAGLRFFLAWIVACSHLQHFVPQSDLLASFHYFSGFSAVLGFLLVSGYSIAHSLDKNPKGFYQRRILRIYPLYALAILVSVLPFWLSKPQIISLDNSAYVQPSLWNFLGNLFFLQNLVFSPLPSNGVVWTLGVEIFCYLLAPFLIKLDKKQLLIAIALSSGSFALYQLLGSPWGEDIAFLRYGLPFIFLLWAWLLGFLYFFYRQNKAIEIVTIALGIVILSISPFYRSNLAIFTYCLSAITLIYCSKIVLPKRLLEGFRYLGEISYPLYLFHSSAFLLGYAIFGIQQSILLMGLALGVSILFYHLVDIPFRLRKTNN
jgi:peptidoglycan/LPS O-acetylase OafA/YrhL